MTPDAPDPVAAERAAGPDEHDALGGSGAPAMGPAPTPPTSGNQIYANPEKWRIGREFLARYTGTDPEAFHKQIVLTNLRVPYVCR